jgi:hypothetical protein
LRGAAWQNHEKLFPAVAANGVISSQ